MKKTKCPVCGSTHFFVRDPDDAYETYEFECREGEVCFDDGVDPGEAPDVVDDTEAYCTSCSWHDRFGKLRDRA